jgi:hypothetical protein
MRVNSSADGHFFSLLSPSPSLDEDSSSDGSLGGPSLEDPSSSDESYLCLRDLPFLDLFFFSDLLARLLGLVSSLEGGSLGSLGGGSVRVLALDFVATRGVSKLKVVEVVSGGTCLVVLATFG